MTIQNGRDSAAAIDTGVTVIDADVEFHGKLRIKGQKTILVRGVIDGEIESNGVIDVDQGGVVRGAIATDELIVAGRVETDQEVCVHRLLTMKKGGVLIASKIIYGDLKHEAGARLTGQLEPCEPPASVALEQPSEPSVQTKIDLTRPVGVPASLMAVKPVVAGAAASTATVVPPAVKGVSELPFRSDVKPIASVADAAGEKTTPVSALELERAY